MPTKSVFLVILRQTKRFSFSVWLFFSKNDKRRTPQITWVCLLCKFVHSLFVARTRFGHKKNRGSTLQNQCEKNPLELHFAMHFSQQWNEFTYNSSICIYLNRLLHWIYVFRFESGNMFTKYNLHKSTTFLCKSIVLSEYITKWNVNGLDLPSKRSMYGRV